MLTDLQRAVQLKVDTYAAILPNGNGTHKPGITEGSEAPSNPLIRAAKGVALGPGAEVGLLKQAAGARDGQAVAKLVRKLLANGNGGPPASAVGAIAPALPSPAAVTTPTPSEAGSSDRPPRACFKCGSFQHLAAQCPHCATPE